MSTLPQSSSPMDIAPALPDINKLSHRASKRAAKPTRKALESSDKAVQRMFGLATCFVSTKHECSKSLSSFVTHTHNISKLFDDTINEVHYYAYNYIPANNDVYILSQMLKLKDIKILLLK